MTISNGFSHFKNNTWPPIFFCAFVFTQIPLKFIEVSCFFSTVIPKLEISFEFGLAFYILLDTWLTFDFCICSLMLWESSFEAKLLNLWLKWLLRNLTLSLLSSFQVKMVNKGSDLVTFVIFSVVRKMKILQNLFKSWSSHNISNALLPMKLFTCPTIFYFIKNSWECNLLISYW